MGGHADGESDLLQVSLRETQEEFGLFVQPVHEKIFDIGVHLIPSYDVIKHYHYDVRFYLKAIDDRPFVVSEESHDLKWVEQKDQLPDNYGIKRMFQKWKRLKTMRRLCAHACILFGIACSNTNKIDTGAHTIREDVHGIVAVQNVEHKVKLKICSKGIDLDTPFFIGSISKQFTAVLHAPTFRDRNQYVDY